MDEKVSIISRTENRTVTNAALPWEQGRLQVMHRVVNASCVQMENEVLGSNQWKEKEIIC